MSNAHHTRDDKCGTGNTYNGQYFGARISAVFVLFAVSAVGSFFPLVALRSPWIKLPGWVFFITKYVGTGVIVATGFIHLLAEAHKALTDPCLGGVLEEYPWTEGIALMGVFLIFFLDLMAHRRIEKRVNDADAKYRAGSVKEGCVKDDLITSEISVKDSNSSVENVYQQMMNSLFLEFGIIFHSVFVGLSLAIAGDEFKTLYIAVAFHQMLEGLGLGTRFATTPWPEHKWYIPWCLSLAYSLTTPVAIAIGIGIRQTYPPGSRTALITTGVFDALCGGVLIYNSLVELMAYDFLFSREFKGNHAMSESLKAFALMCIGGAAMALIGKWA